MPRGRWLESIVDFLFAPRCPLCGRGLGEGAWPPLCRDCLGELEPFDAPGCPCCGKPFESPAALSHSPAHLCADCCDAPPPFLMARSFGPFRGTLREAIHCLKYRGKTQLARPLARLMSEAVRERFGDEGGRLPTWDGVVPVPLHKRRWKERGFDQALLLADELAAQLELPRVAALSRVAWGAPQTGLKEQERRRNVRGAFALAPGVEVEDKAFLLVDDVYTTGATLRECAAVLRRGRARAVFAYTVARTI
ncbi:MAG: double zinc ribbon domain-containing protein [Nitrospinota bacterium]